MGILKRHEDRLTLSLYMYHMFFFPRKLFIPFGIIIIDSAISSIFYFKCMSATPEFCKGTSMSSVVHKYNIILQSMVWPNCLQKLNLLMLAVSVSHSSMKLACNFSLSIILSLL